MKIHTLPALKDNYIYVLSSGSDCVVIDPGEAEPLFKFLQEQKLNLSMILCTHHHHDHIGGIPELLEKFNVPVLCSEMDRHRIAHSTRGLREGDSVDVLGEKMTVLEVPGHTLGQVIFWFQKLAALFVGDTLFSCGCGRLFEGTVEQLFSSLAKISELPPQTQLYFGHEYTLRNIEFVENQGFTNRDLLDYKHACEKLRAHNEPTSPGRLATELKINPFLIAKTVAELRQWREARNTW